MIFARMGLLGLLLVAAAVPAGAYQLDDVHERILEITPYAGAFVPDKNTNYKSGGGQLGLRAVLNNSAWWGIEANLGYVPGMTRTNPTALLTSYNWQPVYTSSDDLVGVVFTDLQSTVTNEELDGQLVMAGASFIAHLSKKRVRPFIAAGGGYIKDITSDKPGTYNNFYADVGLGMRILRPSGWGFRIEVRDHIILDDELARDNERLPLLAAQNDLFSNDGGEDGIFGQEPYTPVEYRAKRWLHNFSVFASFTIPIGWVWKDGDGDLVADRFDNCLTTPPGAVVDNVGCGVDQDEDGVFDGLDQCPATPLGATVDLVGCPSDSDSDGVLDGLDECPDTPLGATVDLAGCPADSDGDGILDGLDQCPDTPIGTAIDEFGCPDDPLEERLLRGETLQIAVTRFEPGATIIDPLSYHYVNKIARLIERWTGNEDTPLKVEIGVHTDGVGSDEYNLDLSQRRADTIRQYLLENFYGIGANNLVAVGYGASQPVGDDSTEEGRAANRRVEIRSLGEGEFPEPYDFGEDEEYDEDFDDFEDLDTPAVEGEDGETTDAPAVDDEPQLDLEEPELPVPDEPELPDID